MVNRKVETRKVDPQGRVSLPPEWLRENLGESSEVVISRDGYKLLIKPKSKSDLTEHFDSVVIDVPPKVFRDPETLRKALRNK